jgi:hypothetical protein
LPSAIEQYREWRKLNRAVGCMFARVMAVNPRLHGQVFEAIPALDTPENVAKIVALRVGALAADKGAAAAALVLPSLTNLEQTARMVLALGNEPMWNVTPSLLENEVVGTLIALRVIRHIPFGETTCPSEALMLGPFDIFAPTRRSPITVIEIFVG